MTNMLLRCLAVLSIVFAALPPVAAREGRTAENEPFLSGGISQDVRDDMLKQRDKYNLWIHTAGKSGEHLSDAHVRINDRAGKTILDTVLDGPWLFVKLKLGAYAVTTNYAGQIQEKRASIHKGDLQRLEALAKPCGRAELFGLNDAKERERSRD